MGTKVQDMCYIAVLGVLGNDDCIVFGLNEDEIKAINKRLFVPLKQHNVSIPNGHMLNKDPITVINVLSELNYRVVSNGGQKDITWTLVRPVYSKYN